MAALFSAIVFLPPVPPSLPIPFTMDAISGLFSTYLTGPINLATVLVGFTLIIVIHELGHFLAARLFGIRVLAFAVGFGPAICSYRRGLGLRRGSSEAEYAAKLSATPNRSASSGGVGEISPTEYRLNWLPFGGYVKMLGQDDADPGATSSLPDSYSSKKPWQRMVVISAGVVFNVLLAAVLFVAVFMVGLRTEPPVIGQVQPGSPAALTAAVNAAELGVPASSPGLQPGDAVISVNGDKPSSFNDLMIASAMGRKGVAVKLGVVRESVPGILRFEIIPELGPEKLQVLGVAPAATTRILDVPEGLRGQAAQQARERMLRQLASLGLSGVMPGAELVAVNGKPVEAPYPLVDAIRASNGRPVGVSFVNPSTSAPESLPTMVAAAITPLPELMSRSVLIGENQAARQPHLIGLVPAMKVVDVEAGGAAAGLKPGDIFVQLGRLEWPGIAEGIAQVRAHAKAGKIRVVVLRAGDDGVPREVELGDVKVGADGIIGFGPAVALESPRLAAWPRLPLAPSSSASGASTDGSDQAPSIISRGIPAGAIVVAVNETSVAGFADIRAALAAIKDEQAVSVTYRLPVERQTGSNTDAMETMTWTPRADELAALRALSWESPLAADDFQREETLLKASSPVEAVSMGLHETRRVMLTTYLTFARLVQGSVKVEHLRGPVGIAHAGTLIAERGFIWLLFFMALISVNLAVVNFLPVPIADGGHIVFLLYEQVSGRPPSIGFQNAAAIAGLVLLGSVFLLVTYNDVIRLFS